MTISRPGQDRREGRGKKTPTFDPDSLVVWYWYDHYGEPLGEKYYFDMSGTHRTKTWGEVTELDRRGARFVVFDIDQTELAHPSRTGRGG